MNILAALILVVSPSLGTAQPTTADALERLVLDRREKRVPAFHAAENALHVWDDKAALEAAKKLDSHPEFVDYRYFIMGSAYAIRARKALAKGDSASGIQAGELACTAFLQALDSNPYTSLRRRGAIELGAIEVALGEMYFERGKVQRALQKFEAGFQRLGEENMLARARRASVLAYVRACQKSPSPLCPTWGARLLPVYGFGEDQRTLEALAGPKRAAVEKATQAPYKVDVDLEAFKKGFAAYMAGKHEAAYGIWRDLLKEFPRTTIKLRTKFWMARAAHRTDHGEVALTLYKEVIQELPFSYYALLSSWHSSVDLSRMIDAEVPAASSENQATKPEDVVHIQRAEQLLASGAPELARWELSSVKPAATMSNEFLVYLALLHHLAGNHLLVSQALSELSQRGYQGMYSVYGQRFYFPIEHLPLIRATAEQWKVDPLVVLSVIKQESAFLEEAISGSNAYGLMQIIGPTARDLDPKVEVAELFQPSRNIHLGTKYISQLMSRYKNNLILALAAYNAGPKNADRWQREAPSGIAPEEFVELISFRETREYVQNIVRNYYWYNRRLKGVRAETLSEIVYR